jgi:hypothetical protein
MGKKNKSPSNANNVDGSHNNNLMLTSMPREPPSSFQFGESLEEQQERHDYGPFSVHYPRRKMMLTTMISRVVHSTVAIDQWVYYMIGNPN